MKVNGLHHSDKPLLRPTRIQIATKSLPRPTNNRNIGNLSYKKFFSSRRITRGQVMRHFTRNGTEWCQNGSSNLLIPYREQPRNLDRLVLLSPTHGKRSQQQSGQITLQSILINKVKFLKATHHIEIKKIDNIEVHGGGGLGLVKPARGPASSRPRPCASLKKPDEFCPFAAPCWPS